MNRSKFYKYLNNQPELADMTNFCRDLRLFLYYKHKYK